MAWNGKSQKTLCSSYSEEITTRVGSIKRGGNEALMAAIYKKFLLYRKI